MVLVQRGRRPAPVASRSRDLVAAALAVFTSLALLPRGTADCTPLNAAGSFNKASPTFYWDLVSSRTVSLTGISAFFNGPDVPFVPTDCGFSTKAESFQASTLSWSPLPVAWAEPFNNMPTLLFTAPPVLQANVTYGMNFTCRTPAGRYHSIKYSAEQWYGGRINVVANDGTLQLLAGSTSKGEAVRYFNGYLWYGSSCTPPPPAALPPPPPYALAPLPSGAAYVTTEAQLVAAVANAAVTDIVVAASFTLTAQLVINRATLRSITGNTGACASADGPDTIWLDYDYSSRVTPFVTALPRMCTLSALTQFRHLSVTTGNLTLANLQFVNGWMSSSFHVSVAPGPGGAVFMSDATTAGCNSTLSVFNCSFAGNSATTNKGGAIAACNLVVDGSSFRENSAKFGGDLYIAGLARVTNSQFNQSVALSSGFGGSIYLDNSVSNFLAMQPSYITNCSFVFDKTYGFTTIKALGGAIYTVLKAQPLVIRNSYIGGYYAITGGGIYLTGNSNLTLIATVVEQCTATANGGAIYAGSGTFLTLINSQIRNNTAVLYGGGVDAEQNTAVFAFSDPAAPPSAPPCSFDSNSISPTLGLGGALYLAVFASVWMDGCVLRNNSAFKGGGVYASPGTVNQWQSYAPRGLALYAPQALSGSASDPYWARGITSRVVTAYFLAVTINAGCIPYGACVFNGYGFLRWEVYIDNSNVTLNTATSNGGAVYSDTDIHCAVVSSRVTGNTAAYGGGGVYVVSNQFASSGSVWSSNAAVAYGGALYADTVPYASVNASTFQANTAGIGGGAIFVTGTALATVGTVFTVNTAAGLTPRGGACYARDSPGISFSQCVFANNSAVAVQPVQVGMLSTVESFGAQQGGAVTVVAATRAMSVPFTGCTFNGNTANSGGVFAIPEAALAVNATFAACTFRNNVAAYQGGVFFVGNTSNLLVCNQSLIEDNVAGFGAVYASRLPYPAVSIDSSSVVGVNSATNYGPLFATVPVVFQPTLATASATTRTGAALAASVTMADAYGQTVAEWPDLKASVTLPNNVSDAFVSGQASAVTLTNGSLLFSFLKLNGVPDATVTLLVTAESPSLPSLDGTEPLSVGISPCAFAEVFMPETLSCKCTDKSRYDADFGGCVCAYSFYMDADEGVCKTCPTGGVCPGNNYPYPDEGFWRAPVNWTKFYQCEDELCLAMEPEGEPAESNCREGHVGLLCAVCADGYTQQGQFCEACAPGSNFDELPAVKRGGILLGLAILGIAMCAALLLPLFPEFVTRMKDAAAALFSRAAARLTAGKTSSKLSGGGFQLEKIQKAGECVRLVIDQVQIVSSFTSTMRIAWPAVFFRIVGVTSVLNVNFIELPNTACMSQRTGFFTYFVGICAGLAGMLALLGALWLGGCAAARRWLHSPPEVVEGFTSVCVQVLVGLLNFAYTPVAEATMSVFSCMRIEDRLYLTIDLREECYTPRHIRYYRAAVFFLVVYVFGIPLLLMRLLYHFNIPQTAAMHKRNARLRVLVVHCFLHGLQQPVDQADTSELTVDTISDEHIDCLYAALFRREGEHVTPAHDANSKQSAAEASKRLTVAIHLLAAVAVDFDDDSPAFTAAAPPQRRLSASERVNDESPAFTAAAPPQRRLSASERVNDESPAFTAAAPPQRRLSASERVNDESPAFTAASPPQRRPSVSERVSAMSSKMTAFFTGEEAPDATALAVRELSREFKMQELLKWSAVHLLIPPLRWRDDEIVDCVEALYSHLHCDSWYWEFAEILRKFVFACVVGFISRGSSGQVTAATFISFIFLAVFQDVRPYAGRRTNMVAFYSYASLLAYFYIALMLKVSVHVGKNVAGDEIVFSALVGALTVGVFAAPILVFIMTIHRLRYKKLNKAD